MVKKVLIAAALVATVTAQEQQDIEALKAAFGGDSGVYVGYGKQTTQTTVNRPVTTTTIVTTHYNYVPPPPPPPPPPPSGDGGSVVVEWLYTRYFYQRPNGGGISTGNAMSKGWSANGGYDGSKGYHYITVCSPCGTCATLRDSLGVALRGEVYPISENNAFLCGSSVLWSVTGVALQIRLASIEISAGSL